jgi:hypothetical protein
LWLWRSRIKNEIDARYHGVFSSGMKFLGNEVFLKVRKQVEESLLQNMNVLTCHAKGILGLDISDWHFIDIS